MGGISVHDTPAYPIVAQLIITLNGTSIQLLLEMFAFFMLTGVISTTLLPDTKGRTLEDLSNENQEGFVKGIELEMQHDALLADITPRSA